MRQVLLVLALFAFGCHNSPANSAAAPNPQPSTANASMAKNDAPTKPDAPMSQEESLGGAPAADSVSQPANDTRPKAAMLRVGTKYKLVAGSLVCMNDPSLRMAEEKQARGETLDPKTGCSILPKTLDAWYHGSDGHIAEVRIPGFTIWTSVDNLSE
jgi:hypothetical protein